MFNLNIPKSDIAYKMHYPLYKTLEYRRSPGKTVIFGDSRADALNAAWFVEADPSDVYNMAYGGGTLGEIIDSFWYASSFGELETGSDRGAV